VCGLVVGNKRGTDSECARLYGRSKPRNNPCRFWCPAGGYNSCVEANDSKNLGSQLPLIVQYNKSTMQIQFIKSHLLVARSGECAFPFECGPYISRR
jgi:hypothetical protein